MAFTEQPRYRRIHLRLRELFGDHEFLWYAINPFGDRWRITFSDELGQPPTLSFGGRAVELLQPLPFQLWLSEVPVDLNPLRSTETAPTNEVT